jgi:hypothetical protein
MASKKDSTATPRALGSGRLLIAVYGVFALAASGRAVFELFTKFELAPLSYTLSAISAVIYLVIAVTLADPRQFARRIALVALWFELIGVLSVGTAGFFVAELGEYHTVWWMYGAAYACFPVALPIFGLYYLTRQRKLASK